MKQASRIYELRPANLPKYTLAAEPNPTAKDFLKDSLKEGKILWQRLQNALPKLKRPQFATSTPPPAKHVETAEAAESMPSAESTKDRLLKGLKYLALYLGAVVTAGAVAIFFLWQIPLVQDLPQLVKNISDPQAVRPAATPTPSPAIEPPTAPQPQVAQTTQPPHTPPAAGSQAIAAPNSNSPAAPPPGSAAAPPVAVTGQPPATTQTQTAVPNGSSAPTGTITVTTTLPPATADSPSTATNSPAPTGTITVNTTALPSTGAAPTPPPNPDGSQATPVATTAAPTTPPTDPAAAATALATTPATTSLTPDAANALTPAQQQQEIRQLLIDAQEQMASRRFVSPNSSNALQSYQRVLELEPTNSVASEGVQRIATYYQQIAQQSLQQGKPDESLSYISRGLRAAPNNETLLRLRRDARSAKQRQEQQRRADLEERRRQEGEVLRRRQEEETAQEVRTAPRQAPPPANWQRQPSWEGQRSGQQPSYYNESGFNQR